MILTETVIRDIEQSALELRQVLGGFSAEQFNQKAQDGWSPGQVAEHILLCDILINRTLKGEIRKADRSPEKMIPAIQSYFTNLGKNFDVVTATIPSDTLKDRAALTEKINLQRQQFIWVVKTMDLTPICTSFLHPEFGELTKLEWIYFGISHTAKFTRLLRGEEITQGETVNRS
ncbi:MAG: DinB family protein [Bacteroidetes bacterium]|nr:DinB family protein [Bacteroidota bacterium]